MDIGTRIKNKRILLMLTQEELANRCELTKGYISQLENNKVSPSIETLEIILEVLGISFSDFFKENRNEKIVFDEETQYIKEFEGYTQTWLVTSSQKMAMEPIMIEIKPNTETFHDYAHTGEEFGYVLEGEIVVVHGDDEHVCKKGESFYFVSDSKHYIKNISNDKAIVIWVACPPNF